MPDAGWRWIVTRIFRTPLSTGSCDHCPAASPTAIPEALRALCRGTRRPETICPEHRQGPRATIRTGDVNRAAGIGVAASPVSSAAGSSLPRAAGARGSCPRGATVPVRNCGRAPPDNPVTCTWPVGPVYSGISTVSTTWMVPLAASMSAMTTCASLMRTVSPSTAKAMVPPCTVVAESRATTSAAVTLPGTTW